ncbi:Epidermal growth factor-like protein 7 [Pseudolycoriella hygida]|uniref:Epidermal growth factor-like protein 7 n=1 Tax=Pseudolycoriella hygida TaxID=35572 RepID=A0A9Q0N2T0_9DIPT|nr:Epidermal growth factor-like protein 7 [Pseudolycoriella hygida]
MAALWLLLSISTLGYSSARLLHNHYRHASHHDEARRHSLVQTNVHRIVEIKSRDHKDEPSKLMLINAHPNVFFNSHFNRRWNAYENEKEDVEINWKKEAGNVTSISIMKSLQDRPFMKYNIGFAHDVVKHRVPKRNNNCCTGWAQISKNTHGCTKPFYKYVCKNGGKCMKPDTCSCLAGFTGRFCELDINECVEEKPCDQSCHNTYGSYYCKCREGFQLLGDKQSCKKLNSEGEDSAFEAKDLENDVDYEQLSSKISKIEKLIGTEQEVNNELQRKIQNSAATMNELRIKIDNMEQRQHEINFIKDRVNALNYLVDVLYKCRTKSSIFCPLVQS